MGDCKYQSFTTLSKINDQDMLLESFTEHVALGHTEDICLEIFEEKNSQWSLVSAQAKKQSCSLEQRIENLNHYETTNDASDFLVYNEEQHTWYSAYYGLAHTNYALFISTPSKSFLIDTDYLQQLFHFYCHQLHMLHGTYHDALTGLLNRRSFDKKLMQLIDQSQSTVRKISDRPSFYVMIDIDHFKKVNDNFGHLYGDEVLLQLAQLMEDSFRDNDLLFRYGGEEFAVVLMNTNDEDAFRILERFRKNVAEYTFPKVGQATISIGFTDFDPNLLIDETIARADSALYYCKDNGRNQTCYYQQLVADGKIEAIIREEEEDLLVF